MNLINGKEIAATIKQQLADRVKVVQESGGPTPHLAAVLVGDDPASESYVKGKEKACREVGFLSSVYKYPPSISETELLRTIGFLNADDDVHGFIVQLPLPPHIDVNKVINSINPAKDVDGFHPENIGRMVTGQPAYLPATPYGILLLLEQSGIETKGKHCVVLGRSNIVGTPISILLSRKSEMGNATVTLCHSHTKNLHEICMQADILIAAIGQPHFVKEDMVKKGAVVIDVGIHRIPSEDSPTGYVITGDVDFENVAPKCSYITPVPGGVGPMTIISLLLNTFKASRKEIYF